MPYRIEAKVLTKGDLTRLLLRRKIYMAMDDKKSGEKAITFWISAILLYKVNNTYANNWIKGALPDLPKYSGCQAETIQSRFCLTPT
jgi:hypothetical protein